MYNLYMKFWGKPLNFEEQVVSVDDDGSGEGTRRFFVLMVDDDIFPDTKGKMIVRAEYIEALPPLEEYYAKFPRRLYYSWLSWHRWVFTS